MSNTREIKVVIGHVNLMGNMKDNAIFVEKTEHAVEWVSKIVDSVGIVQVICLKDVGVNRINIQKT